MHVDRLYRADGYLHLIETLRNWEISLFAGVTGGGIIHFTKHLSPYPGNSFEESENLNRFFNIGEYVAGFVPLGYYLASGKLAAAAATTGAATKLLGCGLTDAKLHNIPAVYIVPISANAAVGFAPLQDSSIFGMNVLRQLEAECAGSTFVLTGDMHDAENLQKAYALLVRHQPVVLVLDPAGLSRTFLHNLALSVPLEAQQMGTVHRPWPLHKLRDRRVVILVGSGMPTTVESRRLTTELARLLRAPVLYSINGANSVERDNPFLYGYIGFGGNDAARSVWKSIDENTVLIALGADFDEYTTGVKPVLCDEAWILGDDCSRYGMVDGSWRHWIHGTCLEIMGPLEPLVANLIDAIRSDPPAAIPMLPAPDSLNGSPLASARAGFVDLGRFYETIDRLWRSNSIGFDDVCMAYKDRQYVTQRPNMHCPFFSLYRGSAMGGALGLGIGARLGAPEKTVFVFTGDGCFRLFAGTLAEARSLGINLFVLNNGIYGIVRNGLLKILPTEAVERYHDDLDMLNYAAIAAGYGWDYLSVDADLRNLPDIIERCYQTGKPSLLIELKVDPEQDLGPNPRVENL
jgi:acetolactate synthase-1/2/3 large subunit